MWKVTAGRGNIFARDFFDRGYIAIGWSEAGNYTQARSPEDLTPLFRQTWPINTEKQISVAVNQVWRFLSIFKIGDRVITYNSDEREYYVGTISSNPTYDSSSNDRLPVRRSVLWSGAVSRDVLSQVTRNTLGAIMTVFQLSDAAAAEIEECLRTGAHSSQGATTVPSSNEADEVIEHDLFANIESRALERVKDTIRALAWDDMQELVAALLRALGYRTIVSPKGADRGRDIVASRDGFGFERPRIVVEVKHRQGVVSAPEVRSFLQTLHHEDRGLYVSTGGFSKEAYYQAENANSVTHLMTIDGLAKAIIEQYENFDQVGRELVSLRKIYWPA